MTEPGSFAARYTRTALAGFAAALVAGALGYYPTVRLGGSEGVKAMVAGCAVATVAGWIGAIPACTGATGAAAINRVLGSTVLRIAVALLLGLAVALSGWFDNRALLIWVAIAYLFTLAADTLMVIRFLRPEGAPDG